MTCCGPAVLGRLTLGFRSGDFHFLMSCAGLTALTVSIAIISQNLFD